MANRPNWGLGRNLKVKIFDEITHTAMETNVNAWLVSLDQEKILGVIPHVDAVTAPKSEVYHVFILYSVE